MESTRLTDPVDTSGSGEQLDDLKVPAAAKRLGISRSTIYKLMDSGELPFIQYGNMRRIDPVELEKYRDRHRVGGHVTTS